MFLQTIRNKSSHKVINIIIYLACLLLITSYDHILYYLLSLKFQLNIDLLNFTREEPQYARYISAFLIAPILEELLFRTHLSGKGKDSWSVYTLCLVVILFLPVNNICIKFLLFAITSLLALYLVLKPRVVYFVLRKYYLVTLIVTTVLFAFSHYSAIYEPSKSIEFTLASIVLIYIPVSFTFAFIRIRYGMILVMVFHSLNNLLNVLANTYINFNI